MNLFATSECPRESARALDDRRVVNQVGETASLLSTATRILIGDSMPIGIERQLHQSTHEASPAALWVRSSWEAFRWTLEHGLALHAEYCDRFPDRQAIHAGAKPIHAVLGISHSHVQPTMFRPLTQPPTGLYNGAANISMGLDFRSITPVTEAYRMYLKERWRLAARGQFKPKWTNAEPPAWFWS